MVTLTLIIVVLAGGIGIGFMLGFSRAMREAAKRVQGTNQPIISKLLLGIGGAGRTPRKGQVA